MDLFEFITDIFQLLFATGSDCHDIFNPDTVAFLCSFDPGKKIIGDPVSRNVAFNYASIDI
jgi:hypothetical protein